MATKPLPVYLEIGTSKVFASAAGWPGWCRCARTEELALAKLADYAERYAEVAAAAEVAFQSAAVTRMEVVDRLPGGTTTNFGAPERTHAGEQVRLTAAAARRQAALLAAAWRIFDAEAAIAPASLRKGPRGGGRDRDKMVDHVIGAETSYARKLGVRHKQPQDPQAVAALRAEILAVVGAASDGQPLTPTGWTTAYATRRMAWHVLDHLWELRDRS